MIKSPILHEKKTVFRIIHHHVLPGLYVKTAVHIITCITSLDSVDYASCLMNNFIFHK